MNRKGATRVVFLVGQWAVKLPNFCDGWRLFLHGLLANMQERRFGKAGWPELCPVLLADPLGFLLIMARAREMTDEEFLAFDAEAFCECEKYIVPAERKSCSFGWLGGKVVAIDYGGFGR